MLRTCLAQYVSHFAYDELPVWSFVLGSSSAGKSETIIEPLSYLPETHLKSALTEHAFISGFGPDKGILANLPGNPKAGIPKNGIILFSDFSTFLSLRPEVRAKLQSDFREIFAGKITKDTGASKKPIQWEGKITIIAACTNTIERYWALNQDLGERFLFLRMKEMDQEDQRLAMRKALTHDGYTNTKTKEIKHAINYFVDPDTLLKTKPLNASQLITSEFEALCFLVEKARTAVHRDQYGNLESSGNTANPMRLAKQCARMMAGHIVLERREEPIGLDYKIAAKAVLDCIPEKRWKLLNFLWTQWEDEKREDFDYGELAKEVGLVPTYFNKFAEEMQLLGLIERDKRGKMYYVKLSDEVKELMNQAKGAID